MSPTVVVIGGGYGGATVAKALDQVAEVVLVEQRDAFFHNVAALRGVVDPQWADRMFLPYDALLSRGRVVHARAERVEPDAVFLASGERIEADFLVLATGSNYPFPAGIDLLDAASARSRLDGTREALAAAGSVLLLGAGPVGLEFAGEIRAAWPDKRITVVDPREDVLGGDLPQELRVEMRRQLAEAGVDLVLGTRLTREPPSAPGQAETFTAVLDSGAELKADIWFRCYGSAPVTGFLGSGLSAARQPSGLLEVLPTLQLPGHERVFALGDVTAIAEAKKAKAAEDHAQVVAANISTLIAGGGGELVAYRPGGPMMALSFGPSGGAGYTPATGLLGPAMVARAKSGDLRTAVYEELFGLSPAAAPAQDG
ncbi:FAD-dependent oxidoreductase [Streptacidiphilus sp. PAMC 29251]